MVTITDKWLEEPWHKWDLKLGCHELRPKGDPKLEWLQLHGRKIDVFLSHIQRTGQDQIGEISQNLQSRECVDRITQKTRKVEVWHDMEAKNLTAVGMEAGVAQSAAFVIFLSKGYMSRPFCRKECRWAKRYNLKFIGIVEHEEDHGQATFADEIKSAPADLKDIFDEIEFIHYHRREPFKECMMKEVLKQAGVIDADDSLVQMTSPHNLHRRARRDMRADPVEDES